MATHATAPISAVPATDPNPVMATAQIDPNGGAVSWPGARPYLELDDGSSDASPVALVDGDIIEIAAPAILAISASASDSTAMAAAAPGSDLAEAHSSLEGTGASDTSSPAPSADRVPAEPRDAISAISASAFDAATGRAVTSPDAAVPIAAHPPADDGTSPPRLDAHERRRGRWRENRVPLHQPLDQAPAVA